MSETEKDTDAAAAEMQQNLAASMRMVTLAERIAKETLKALIATPGGIEHGNKLAGDALAIITGPGSQRMIAMTAAAAIVASLVNEIVQSDLADNGKALPSDALVMAVGMMAQQLIKMHQTRTASADGQLDAAVKADPNHAH
jgi:hypothetical protein